MVHDRIWPNFELIQALIYGIITCKYEKDLIKSRLEKVATPFSPNITVWGFFKTFKGSKLRSGWSNPAKIEQGQLLEGVECHIYLYCYTFDDIYLNRAFVYIVLFPKKYSNKKVCANGIGNHNALGFYWYIFF